MRNLIRTNLPTPLPKPRQLWLWLACAVALTPYLAHPAIAQPSPGWQQHLPLDNYDFARGMLPTPDGGYLVAGHTGANADLHEGFLVKLDPFGGEQWRRVFGGPTHDLIEDIEPTSDGGYVLCGSRFLPGQGGFQFWLVKINRQGDMLWEKNYGSPASDFSRAVVPTSDGGFALVGRTDDGSDVGIFLVKTDPNGNEEWSAVYGGPDEDEAWGVAETTDNQLVVIGTSSSFSTGDRDIYLAKISLTGAFQWYNTFGGADDDLAFSVIPVSTGGLLVGGTTRSFGAGDYDVFMVKTADNGTLEWQKTYGGAFGEWGAYLLEMPLGGFALAGATQSFNNLQDDIYLVRTDATGNQLWQRTFGQARKDIPHSIQLAPDGGFLLAAHSRVDTNGVVESSQAYVLRTDQAGNLLSNYLTGRVLFDDNDDCLSTPGEMGAGGWHLRASGANGQFFGYSDANGNYSILTDSGTYTLQLVSPNSYWAACQNNVPLSFSGLYDTLSHDFLVQKNLDCPSLRLDLGTAELKPCAVSTYHARYCNEGTEWAQSPWLEVGLDPHMQLLASQIAPTAQVGQTLRFDLPDLGVGECSGFSFEVQLACDAELGRTHMLRAHIFPDSSCLPANPAWDEASLSMAATCETDSVRFVIKNIGGGGMQEPQACIIIEDQIVGRAVEFQLEPNDSIVVKQPVSGQTVRANTFQSPGHPGLSRPTLAVEGCNGLPGSTGLGFVNMFPEDDADPFLSVDGRESAPWLSADEPLAFPKGIGNQHFIKQGAEIEYQLVFKNTGEDTLFTAVLLDTLSPWLDVASVRPGAASHPYTLTVSNTGVLQFRFENLQLPDSLTNDSQSVGFVRFKVSQLAAVPFDSLIHNHACITLDYGLPSAKPAYFHTIQKPEILSFSDVSLCMGGIYQGVAYQGDTAFVETFALPTADSLHFVSVDVGEFGILTEIDTFTYLGTPLNGWLLQNDTVLVEAFDIGHGCDSLVVWSVAVLTNTSELGGFGHAKLYPTPSNGHFFFETAYPNSDLRFQLLAATGQAVPIFPHRFVRQNGISTWSFSLKNGLPGLYFLQVKSPHATKTLKLVIGG